MQFKTRMRNTFKNRVMKPLLKRLDAWEYRIIDRPEALRGGEDSPLRFHIPRKGLKMEGYHTD